ncbi:predicted protein [Arabidopsis lyrata subsp. lyrata]|uniref:Predicted protein n=1 Tax=Arabidopsis lyrata subsp. lyrata TaxID=81972 RepID=D7MPJ1_ARALL|nr:predicted protein [Arabidopsis lyrata subsp. lyrata]
MAQYHLSGWRNWSQSGQLLDYLEANEHSLLVVVIPLYDRVSKVLPRVLRRDQHKVVKILFTLSLPPTCSS